MGKEKKAQNSNKCLIVGSSRISHWNVCCLLSNWTRSRKRKRNMKKEKDEEKNFTFDCYLLKMEI